MVNPQTQQFDTCVLSCTICEQLTLKRAPEPELSSFSVDPPKTCSNSQSISGKTRRHKYELRITRDKLVKPVTD